MNDRSDQLQEAPDLARLPLFQTDSPVASAGRRRSTFSLVRGSASVERIRAAAAPANIRTATPKSAVTEPVPDVAEGRAGAAVEGELDWELVRSLRVAASGQLMRALEGSSATSVAEQHRLGRRIIADLVVEEVAQQARAGVRTLSPSGEQRVAQAVFDALFRLGRLQPLVDDERVENIIIQGCDVVWLEYADGRVVAGPAVADSDQELIDFLVFVASRSEANARQFSEAEPRLHLRLDGGARLAATAWVTPRPSVVIRRHRLQQVTLDDLVGLGSLSATAASFLRAAVRSRRSIVVAGAQGAGKTTMVRALCAEIGPDEAIGTFETEYELHLGPLYVKRRLEMAS